MSQAYELKLTVNEMVEQILLEKRAMRYRQ